jgi:ElaB/YqjD/DUF883 family membrane-anchored ribosome-binding protein
MTPAGKFTDPATEVKSLGDSIASAASEVKNKVADYSSAATRKIDETRSAAASGLDSTASALHEGGEKVTSLAHSAANTLSSTADYLRNNDVKRMMTDVEQLIKNNPGPSLIAAGVIGFLAGRAMRSRD